jgi:hypothetical protein
MVKSFVTNVPKNNLCALIHKAFMTSLVMERGYSPNVMKGWAISVQDQQG